MKTIVYQNGTNLTIGPCRLSFPKLFELDSVTGKYGCCLLIPKELTDIKEALDKAVESAKKDGIMRCWQGRKPAQLTLPVQDGDELATASPDGKRDYMRGHWVLSPKSNKMPPCADVHGMPLLDQSELYSGCWVSAILYACPYCYNGMKCGVTMVLRGVQKAGDGDPLGGAQQPTFTDISSLGLVQKNDEPW